MSKIIEVLNVSKSFYQKKVLDKVSFSLEEGKFITLIGCNGAGKSTTLRLLAGVESPDSGEISVMGGNPYSFEYMARHDMFFIHENVSIEMNHNLLDMVKIYREIFPNWSNKIFNQFLKERKISLKKQFSELSRGQKMQFLLMMGLSARPKIMFLDEITAVIDIEGQRYFLDQLKNFTTEGGTVVITTNILSELNDYTDHLVLLQSTKLQVNEPVEELQKKFYLLKQTEDHQVFSHPQAAKVRKDTDGNWVYLIPRAVYDEDTSILKFKLDYSPRLEDILILYFHLKEDAHEDELVA